MERNIPWSNKLLAVSFETFRDKLEPGSNEKWKLRVKGEKTDAVSAELLLNMYDASLDQFYEHKWQLPNVWPFYFTYGNSWSSASNFVSSSALAKPWDETRKYREKVYDKVPFFETGDRRMAFAT